MWLGLPPTLPRFRETKIFCKLAQWWEHTVVFTFSQGQTFKKKHVKWFRKMKKMTGSCIGCPNRCSLPNLYKQNVKTPGWNKPEWSFYLVISSYIIKSCHGGLSLLKQGGEFPPSWLQICLRHGLQSRCTLDYSHFYASCLCVLSGNASSRLTTDWQFLYGTSHAAGDLTNERKSWRDLCLTPQSHFLFPLSTSGQMRGLWLQCKVSDFAVFSNYMQHKVI